MRLICPNCGAQYEVDDNVIPDAGRDVQCSNCGHTWFQRPANMDADLAEELGHELHDEGDTATDAPKGRRGLDPEIAGVLREEATREAEARRAEAAGLETQPDLGLDDAGERAADRSAAARARMARMRGLDDSPPEAKAGAAAAAAGSRRELLPDIEEINSTLRASQDREDGTGAAAVSAGASKPRRRGFRLGFGLSMLTVIAAVLVYRFAPRITEAVPQSQPYLIAYVEWANAMRGQVNANLDTAIAWANAQIARVTGGGA